MLFPGVPLNVPIILILNYKTVCNRGTYAISYNSFIKNFQWNNLSGFPLNLDFAAIVILSAEFYTKPWDWFVLLVSQITLLFLQRFFSSLLDEY